MNIFVGNLNHQTTENELRRIFTEFGEVKSVSIVSDKYTGRSRGFGFVVMENNTEAEKAVHKLNNTMVNQQSIVVNEAKPQTNNTRSNNYSDIKRTNRY